MSDPRKRYFNSAIALKSNATSDYVNVKGYFNGLFWVFPNPEDSKLSGEIEQQYNMGYFLNYQTFKVPRYSFDNLDNWTS
jgi:hypothetical protein